MFSEAKYPCEAKPLVLDGRCEINWSGIFNLALKNPGVYQEVRVNDPDNEATLVSFFEIAYTIGNVMYLHFQEFSSEKKRLQMKGMFNQEVEDIDPRGFRVRARDRKLTI